VRPLDGMRVIDLTRVLAGPYATMLLADMGAEVIKVEEPGKGDDTRAWPAFAGGESTYFMSVNRGKKSVTLDLKAEAGKTVLRKLLAGADVLVENFRSGGLERLGFGDAELAAMNPSLVHLAITGYGAGAPDPGRPGYDFVIQAESGLMSITGAADGQPGAGPMKIGVALSDVLTGLNGAVAILAALVARQREDDGVGQRIDLNLLASSLAALVNQAQNAFVGGEAPVRLGNAHPNIVPYETFETADGTIAVAVGSERQWPRFCMALGLPALADDPRFATNGDRVANRAELIATLGDRFAEDGSEHWLAALAAADVPAGPINDVAQAFASPWAAGRTVTLRHPVLGATTQVAPPFQLSRTPATVRIPPPLLGEQSADILAELGYDAAAIDRLRADGVI
jgi:crotonobetainyl-CoA:carnitine CoA-transferase CaiB-like acyl-CoA transferase